jgi:hypothetical protein
MTASGSLSAIGWGTVAMGSWPILSIRASLLA